MIVLKRRNQWLTLVLLIFSLGSFVRLAQDAHTRVHAYQRDFEVYYNSPLTLAKGDNPYIKDFYVYPPLTLSFFKPLSSFSIETAARVFLWIKLLAFILLVSIWVKFFVSLEIELGWFFLFCLLSFYGTVNLEFRAGNISIFEQLFLWIGFSALLKKRAFIFYSSVVFVSLFKITPILFVLLGPLVLGRRQIGPMVAAVVAFGTLLLSSYLSTPVLFTGFLTAAASRVGEGGLTSPSVLALFRDVSRVFQLPSFFPSFAHLTLVSVVIALTVFKLKSKVIDGKLMIYIVTVVYCLLLPRLKDYSYILLIPAAYQAILATRRWSAVPFVFILFTMFAPQVPMPPWINRFYEVMWQYFSVLVTFAVWAILLYSAGASGTQRARTTK